MNEEIEDAEWEEVPGNKGALRARTAPSGTRQDAGAAHQLPEPSPWLSGEFWRSTLRTGCFGLIAVFGLLMAISVLNSDPQPEVDQRDAPSGDASMFTAEWLSGNWVMTPKGGEDGKTSCGDFNVPALYRLNGSTAKLLSFGVDGKYRSLFAYTAPSGNEHTQLEVAEWSVDGDTVIRQNVFIDNPPFEGPAENDAATVRANSANVMTVDYEGATARYVRCIGNVDQIFGNEAIAEVSSDPLADPARTSAPDLAELCSDKETIDNLVSPFRGAVGQVLLGLGQSDLAVAGDSGGTLLFRSMIIGDRLKKATYKFFNIRNVGIDGLGTGTITIRCRTNLRLVEPIDETNGAFSTYVQFNDAHYSIRITNADSNNPELYVLAEIQPMNGQWDIISGTE